MISLPDDWNMDNQESYAKLVVTFQGGSYLVTTECIIRPYPNPASFGGWVGLTSVHSDLEADDRISEFLLELEHYKLHGLTRIEIVDYRQLYRQNRELLNQIVKKALEKTNG